MRKLYAFTLVAFLAALPASAAITNCTNAMVTAGLCASNQDILVSYTITNGAQARILDGITAAMNYQATIPCAAAQVVDDGVLVVAGPGDGTCTVPLIGTTINNPQTKKQAADRWIRRLILSEVAKAERTTAHAATDTSIQATPTPVVP